jgi:hypothetical protein
MKNIILFLGVLCASGMAHAQMPLLRAGTALRVQFTKNMSCDTLEAGQILEMETVSAVTVNGRVVIASGAPVEAQITKINKSTDPEHTAAIMLVVIACRDVAGQNIELRSTPYYVKALRSGLPCTIQAGTSLEARVLRDGR